VNARCPVGLLREIWLLTGRGPSTLLRILNWVSCLRTYWYVSVFLCVSTFNFVQNHHFQVTGSSGSYVVRKVGMLQAGGRSSLSSDETWVTCFKEYLLPLSVSMEQEYHFVQHHPFEGNGRSSEALPRKFLRLEARGSSNLCNSVSRVKFSKEDHLPLTVWKCEELHFRAKLPVSMKGRITGCLVGEPHRLQERCTSTLFSSFNWFSIQKEHCLSVRVWQCEHFHLCANRPFHWMEQALCLLQADVKVCSRSCKHIVSLWELS
jgi:hypothetical protein